MMEWLIRFRVWDGKKQQMFRVRELFWRGRGDPDEEMIGNYWWYRKYDRFGETVWFPRTEPGVRHDDFRLMQYSGYNDAHKVPRPIFENDICRVTGGWSGKVSAQVMYPLDNHHFWQEVQDNIEAGAKYTVIGDIYRNPELLKEADAA
jgi:hypothetical protein